MHRLVNLYNSLNSTIVRAPANTYDESLFWRAWDLLIQEMTGKHAKFLAEALCSPECESEDVGTVLRHLALGRLCGWYVNMSS